MHIWSIFLSPQELNSSEMKQDSASYAQQKMFLRLLFLMIDLRLTNTILNASTTITTMKNCR